MQVLKSREAVLFLEIGLCYRKQTKFEQGNIFSSVCQGFYSQGRGAPGQVHPRQVPPAPGRHTPLGQVHPPGRYTPLGRYTRSGQVHPSGRYTLRDTVNERAVSILLECILV